METNQQELIDQYLSGRMDEAAAAAFEKDVASDPALGEEVAFQRNIIGGIREYRKVQLKQRLSQVSVEPSWVESALHSTGAKVTYFITAAAIGTAIYLSLPDEAQQAEESFPSGDEVVISGPQTPQLPPEVAFEVPEREEDQPVQVNRQASVNEARQQQSHDASPISTPSFNPPTAPSDVLSAVDEDFEAEVADVTEIDNPAVIGSSMINIEVTGNAKTKSYKYYDGRLLLSGDFSDSTYEVIELNTEQDREIYLYYNGKYYPIILTRVTIPLKEITSKTKIRELEVIRTSK